MTARTHNAARAWLLERRITLADLRDAGFGDPFEHEGRIVRECPYRRSDGTTPIRRLVLPAEDGAVWRWRPGAKAKGAVLILGDAQTAATVVVCEGESDGLAAWRHLRDDFNFAIVVIPGTGVVGGDLANHIGNGQVVVAFDADAAGDKGADEVVRVLVDAGVDEDLVTRFRPPEGQDLRAVIEAMEDASDDMQELVESLSSAPPLRKGTSRLGHEYSDPQTPVSTSDDEVSQVVPSSTRAHVKGGARAVTVCASDVEVEAVRWLWPGRLPLGKFVLLDGDPDEGKTAVMLDVAARVTHGDVMPDGSIADLVGAAGVVIVGDEDGIADTLTPRLVAAGADLARVVFLTEVEAADGPRPLDLPGDLPLLDQVVRDTEAALVIADPLFGYLATGTDAGRDHSVRRALIPIVKAAGSMGATVWATRHLNKSGGGRALYRGGESIAFIASSRVALLAGPDPSDEGRKLLAVTKCNIARKASTLAYRLIPHDDTIRVSWEGDSDVTADGVIAAADPERRSQESEADLFIRDAFQDGEWRDSREVKREAASEGITPKQLRAARERVGVEIERTGRRDAHGSRWRLPITPAAVDRWEALASDPDGGAL